MPLAQPPALSASMQTKRQQNVQGPMEVVPFVCMHATGAFCLAADKVPVAQAWSISMRCRTCMCDPKS